jgi:G3E family GTPase
MSASSSRPATARYIMIGGFLGAGKTTAVAALARHLTDSGLKVGLITNDQSTHLVDTAMLRAKGFAVEEIAGGCFCCRFNSLSEAAERLTEASRPDIFIAEPVGSCTDLVATVSYPLRRIYGDRFTIAPLSVMVDPTRAARVFGLQEGRSFSPKVVYVYTKQLEEANLIIVNKCDLIDAGLRDRLAKFLRDKFPRATVLCCAARTGDSLGAWFDMLQKNEAPFEPTMQIDYDTYAEGEALLGWLNCTVRLTTDRPVDGNRLLVDLTEGIGRRLDEEGCEIAHLKMTLDAGDKAGNLSVVSLARGDAEPDLRESLLDTIDGGSLIINLRAEADPDLLRRATVEALRDAASRGQPSMALTMEHSEHFRPARPVPTYRMQVAP